MVHPKRDKINKCFNIYFYLNLWKYPYFCFERISMCSCTNKFHFTQKIGNLNISSKTSEQDIFIYKRQNGVIRYKDCGKSEKNADVIEIPVIDNSINRDSDWIFCENLREAKVWFYGLVGQWRKLFDQSSGDVLSILSFACCVLNQRSLEACLLVHLSLMTLFIVFYEREQNP